MLNNFEVYLEDVLSQYGNTQTKSSMAYSLQGGGKRLRPALLSALVKDLGLDHKGAYPCGAALEMIHTYSLIHDDLPAMDNDDFRRHKPTNHKVYGEGQAILAGDALLTAAFEIVADSESLSSHQKVKIIKILSKNAGANGMILGQELDTEDNIHSLEDLNKCYELKTGCLFSAALEMATVIAERFELQETASHLGLKLGLAFQYQDDILEATTSFDTLGKSASSDLDRDKTTIVSLLGLEEANKLTDSVFDSMLKLINSLNLQENSLIKLIEKMTQRTF